MSARVNLERCIVVSDRYNLLEIDGQKRCNGARLFILVDVPEFMRE